MELGRTPLGDRSVTADENGRNRHGDADRVDIKGGRVVGHVAGTVDGMADNGRARRHAGDGGGLRNIPVGRPEGERTGAGSHGRALGSVINGHISGRLALQERVVGDGRARLDGKGSGTEVHSVAGVGDIHLYRINHDAVVGAA